MWPKNKGVSKRCPKREQCTTRLQACVASTSTIDHLFRGAKKVNNVRNDHAKNRSVIVRKTATTAV